MWKLDFYLLPSINYEELNFEDALEFGEKIDDIRKMDHAFVPDEFYEVLDEKGLSGAEYLYLNGHDDVSSYLQEVISKQSSSRETYEMIAAKETKGYVAISDKDTAAIDQDFCVCSTKESYENGMVKNSDIISIKRRYLLKSATYDILKDRISICFPRLLFHENALYNIRKLGKLADVKDELSRHLTALNDYGKRIYDECDGNEENALNCLKSRCGIVCSGKGSNETITFKKVMYFEEKEYSITCNSHTKFYNGNNDQRIYFSWGRKEICDHKLVIISIGPHWKK